MNLILPFLFAFLITSLTVPFTIKLARKYGLVDDPAKRLHPAQLHSRIIPRAGGLTIYIGITLSLLIFLPSSLPIVGIIAGISILLIMGLIDDKKIYFSPYQRLILLFLAAGAPVISGIGIVFIANPFYGLNILPDVFNEQFILFDKFSPVIYIFGIKYTNLISNLFAFLYIVTITQVINWSKGVDGQMPGITLITAITLGILSLKLFAGGDPKQLELAEIAFIIAGTSLGFLVFNWHPAKIFPGFSGSTILAFMLATLSILSGAKVATALLVLAVPAVDFIYTISRRILSGKSPVWGDRGHLHHRLLDIGLKQEQIALFYIGVSIILGGISLILDSQSKFFGVLIVGVIFVGLILWLNSFYERRN